MADIQVINCEFHVYCDSYEFIINTIATYTVQHELFKQVSKEFTHTAPKNKRRSLDQNFYKCA